jgi:RNA polymerase sigma factor (sigma-70 family)
MGEKSQDFPWIAKKVESDHSAPALHLVRTLRIGRAECMKIETQGSVLRSIQTLFSAGSVGGMTDGELLETFLSRRDELAEAAFAALVALHGPMVWRVCQGVLPDSHAAEDAFQATFLILVRKARSIRHRDALASWLYGVARRVAVRAKTNATLRRRHEGQGAEMNAKPIPSSDPSRREQLEVLHQELDRLPEKYRAAVVLCHLEGRTHAEAARLLKCPISTVSIRVARARELLRDRLTRRGLALPAALAGVTLLSETASAAIPKGLAESTINVAMQVATGKATVAGVVSAAVAQLTEGVIKTMSMTKLTVIATGVLVVGIATAGAGLLAAGGGPAQVGPGAAAPAAAAAPAQADANDRGAKGEKSTNNLKQIGLAMHNFAQDRGNFPPAAIRKDGKPLLSWRVALLPYLDEKALYEKFHLDEPWDSPHNKTLLDQMPDVYAPVLVKDEPKYSTFYQVFAGPSALFGGDDGPKLQDIKDGMANTIMVVEAAKPVLWTRPDDLPFGKEKPLPELGGLFKDGFHAGLADGSVRFINKKVDPDTLRALITSNGGEVIRHDQF